MEKGWFGPKRIGWGVSPRSWQGWLVSALIIAGLAASTRWLGPIIVDRSGISPSIITGMIVAVWLLIYGGVIWLTYERKS
jgi:hypothetical protein